MSDGTGFGTGGTSGLLTVADPVGGATCDTATPSLAFDFQLNTALQQWRSGGSSDLFTVGASDDASCINANSPGSTITAGPTSAAPSASASKTRSASAHASSHAATASATAEPSNSGKSTPGGIIAGAIIGVIVLLLLCGSLIWFLLRRHRKKKDSAHVSTQFRKRRSLMPIDGVAHDQPSAPLEPGGHYEAEPYVLPTSATAPSTHAPSEGGYYPPRAESESADGNRYVPGVAASSSHTSKYSEAFSNRGPPNTPARFVLHTDAGEIPQEADEEVVELPPQYTSLTGGAAVNRAPTYRQSNTQNAPSGAVPPLPQGQQPQQGGYPS
ncbi:hypothetical protein FRC00_004559, partial [Tulasnella sp. 408]